MNEKQVNRIIPKLKQWNIRMEKAQGEVIKHGEDLGVSVQEARESWKMIKKKVPNGNPFYPTDKRKNWEEMGRISGNAKRKVS